MFAWPGLTSGQLMAALTVLAARRKPNVSPAAASPQSAPPTAAPILAGKPGEGGA
tara:strand:+ start:1377 stop:1541 length:165 start_codon:yes stop_codon:yes gene_type:complete